LAEFQVKSCRSRYCESHCYNSFAVISGEKLLDACLAKWHAHWFFGSAAKVFNAVLLS
jgi:hypothetical protein